MAPPTDAHGTIVVNVGIEIADRLRSRPPCRAIGEAGIRLDDGNHYKADVAATCAEPRGSLYVEEPFLIVEVISESSERDDFGLKAQRYIQLPSVHEIWLIDSRERWVQVWRRAEDAWIVTLPLRADAVHERRARRPRSSSTPSTATPASDTHRFITSSAPHRVRQLSPRSNAVMLASVVSAIAVSASLREERLVAGDQHVGEGEQALEDVVLDDLVGEVLEEQVGLLLVDVDREVADPART